MRYYVQFQDDRLIAIGKGLGGVEITKEEYERLLAETCEKAALVDLVHRREIAIGSVPAEWQEEIQLRVDKLNALQEEAAANIPEEAQYAEAGRILMGVTE